MNGIPATFVNEKYGKHERNNFDIWLAESDVPTPLVIYIHGGGFISGDKSRYYKLEDVTRFLDAGVSVATINYRFMNEPPYGILASMEDSKRCLQFIRHNAQKYNIDKERIACAGGSAGAGTALWLAFSDDMLDQKSGDPVMKESTRIACAGAFATQATYDILKWDQILGLPDGFPLVEKNSIARAYGFKSADHVDAAAAEKIRQDLDFLSKMHKDVPPFFVYNKQKGGIPTDQDELNHHPKHAKALKDRAMEVGAEAVIYAPEIGIVDPSGKDIVEFFLEKLYN